MIDVRVLTPDVDRTKFRSGDPDLDGFFWRYAGQNQFRHHVGVSYVAGEDGAPLGFVTVAATQVESEVLPGRLAVGLPRHPYPALRLARLAVAEGTRGRGIGQLLVRFVLELALVMAEQVGCVGVVVDAKPGAIGFYRKLGFVEVETVSGELADRPVPVTMFLGIGVVRAAS
jgi:GNAT superfamily N-acetyltransferase